MNKHISLDTLDLFLQEEAPLDTPETVLCELLRAYDRLKGVVSRTDLDELHKVIRGAYEKVVPIRPIKPPLAGVSEAILEELELPELAARVSEIILNGDRDQCSCLSYSIGISSLDRESSFFNHYLPKNGNPPVPELLDDLPMWLKLFLKDHEACPEPVRMEWRYYVGLPDHIGGALDRDALCIVSADFDPQWIRDSLKDFVHRQATLFVPETEGCLTCVRHTPY
ncbi:MAG: hypothetical protein AAB383_02570 [Patescibacteria group bacterium]